ncbi:MAG: HupE/UreJ family protein [Myxococcota bacterium]
MRRAIFSAVLTACLAGPALAHGQRSAWLNLREISSGRALVEWSTPSPEAPAQPVFPEECTVSDLGSAAATRRFLLECPGTIAGRSFEIRGLGAWVADATIVAEVEGRTASAVLHRDASRWTVPTAEAPLEIAVSYVRRGLIHILSGADHLLFLVLLALGLRRPRAVLWAETAFTASHSLSFSLTALGLVHLPAAPTEACIALSLVLLALDLDPRGAPQDARLGALSAFIFGLVHGLGFAGGLEELGLPDQHAAVALLGFGAGVELGQVLFLALLLVVLAWVGRQATRWLRVAQAATWLAGGTATFWLGERLLAVFF